MQNATSFGTNDVTMIFIGYCIRMEIYFVDTKIVSENDQEISHSQTADKPMAPRATQTSRDKWKTNQAKQPALFPIKMIVILEWT